MTTTEEKVDTENIDSEQNKDGDGDGTVEKKTEVTDDQQKKSDADNKTTVPLAALKSEKSKRQKLEVELDELKAEQKARDEAKLKEDGKLDDLVKQKEKEIEDKDAKIGELQVKADQFDAFREAKVEEAKKALGDKWSHEYGKLSVTALEGLVNSLNSTSKPTKTGDDGVEHDQKKAELSDKEKKEAKLAYPHLPEEKAFTYYAENLETRKKAKQESEKT